MERLTMTSDKGGVAFTFDLDITCKPSEAQKILKLAQKVKEYEDAEEQGLLLRLPCKVGDKVYLVDFEEKAYDEATVWSIEIDTKDNRILINSDYEIGTWAEDGYLFYSREEAEQALAEMQKG